MITIVTDAISDCRMPVDSRSCKFPGKGIPEHSVKQGEGGAGISAAKVLP